MFKSKPKTLDSIQNTFETTRNDLHQFVAGKDEEIHDAEQNLKVLKDERQRADKVLVNITTLLSD